MVGLRFLCRRPAPAQQEGCAERAHRTQPQPSQRGRDSTDRVQPSRMRVRLYRLTREHFRHRNRVEPLYGPDFMPQLARTLRERSAHLRGGTRTSECLAMLAVVRSGAVGMMTWIGIEQHRRRNDFTYANLSFYHPADWAPALGLRTLIYGRAAQEAKAKRGCRLLLCHLFYRPSSSVARWLAAPLLAIHQLRNTRRNDDGGQLASGAAGLLRRLLFLSQMLRNERRTPAALAARQLRQLRMLVDHARSARAVLSRPVCGSRRSRRRAPRS